MQWNVFFSPMFLQMKFWVLYFGTQASESHTVTMCGLSDVNVILNTYSVTRTKAQVACHCGRSTFKTVSSCLGKSIDKNVPLFFAKIFVIR